MRGKKRRTKERKRERETEPAREIEREKANELNRKVCTEMTGTRDYKAVKFGSACFSHKHAAHLRAHFSRMCVPEC